MAYINLESYVSTKLVGLPALHPPIVNSTSYGTRGVLIVMAYCKLSCSAGFTDKYDVAVRKTF